MEMIFCGKKASEVDKFDGRLHQLLDDMAEIHVSTEWCQDWLPFKWYSQTCYYNRHRARLIELVNPVILETSGHAKWTRRMP